MLSEAALSPAEARASTAMVATRRPFRVEGPRVRASSLIRVPFRVPERDP